MGVAAEVEEYIVEEIASGQGVSAIAHDEDLLADEVIDSLGIVALVSFLEGRYGIRVGDDDLVPENFKSVNDVAALVARKKG
jgi:acyl carrier protein